MKRTTNMMRKLTILMLTAAMFLTMLPVNVEAKKLGKIQMIAGGASNLRERQLTCNKLFNDDNPSGIDYPERGYTWSEMNVQLYCKPKDVFTLIPDQKGFDRYNNLSNMKPYGKIVWSSSNTDVATVNKNGKVTVVGEGYAIISAGIRVKGYDIYGNAYDEERKVCYHHIFSGPVLQLSKTNVKAVAKNADAIAKNHRVSIIRTKGTMAETKALFETLAKELKKYGYDYKVTDNTLHEIGNFTYWW